MKSISFGLHTLLANLLLRTLEAVLPPGKAALKPPRSKLWREVSTSPNFAKRLDCGGFSTALEFAALRIVLLLAGLVALDGRGQSLTVNGVADRSIYNDSVTFTVVTQSGFNYSILLDAVPVTAGAPVPADRVDYHELKVYRTNQTTLDLTNRLIRFIVRSSARADTEDGIPPWTPWPLIDSTSNELAGAHVRLLTPQNFPAGYPVPVVSWIENDLGHAVRANGTLAVSGQAAIQIRRGVGSGFLAATNPAGPLQFVTQMRQLALTNLVNLESNTVWTSVSGTLSGITAWPANARIAVTANLTIPSGSSLTIGTGAVIRVGPGVDINLNGQLFINGTTAEPVVFMPVSAAQPWGGFLLQASAAQIAASGVIFTGSGAVQNWFGTGGHPGSHRPEQALFFCSSTPALAFTDCAAIYLAGQLAHSVNGGTFAFTRFLMQHTTTGGEFTGAAFKVNDSAFIECPDATTNFVDGDNDALYFVDGTHGFTNTLFGWTKDDGVDSGGSGTGLLNFQSCWFESVFHEGNSLSGNSKIVNHYGDVFLNCGQGLEAGYEGPVGTLAGCLATANLIGGRFGDNYIRTYTGFLRATNSLLINNYRDVWGLNWQDWTYRTGAMDVRSNFLSVPNPFHPANTLWQALSDGWRLAAFMTTPPDADVGVGLAVGGSPRAFDDITNGLPLRLSSFTTNLVTVDYRIEAPDQILLSGTLAFQPGETLKYLPSLPAPPAGPALLRLQLADPVHAEITTSDSVYFIRGAAPSLDFQLLRFENQWVLFWTDPAATLQETVDLGGTWSDVSASSPFEMDVHSGQKFYRLKK